MLFNSIIHYMYIYRDICACLFCSLITSISIKHSYKLCIYSDPAIHIQMEKELFCESSPGIDELKELHSTHLESDLGGAITLQMVIESESHGFYISCYDM